MSKYTHEKRSDCGSCLLCKFLWVRPLEWLLFWPIWPSSYWGTSSRRPKSFPEQDSPLKQLLGTVSQLSAVRQWHWSHAPVFLKVQRFRLHQSRYAKPLIVGLVSFVNDFNVYSTTSWNLFQYTLWDIWKWKCENRSLDVLRREFYILI